jgi:hypothetical protein
MDLPVALRCRLVRSPGLAPRPVADLDWDEEGTRALIEAVCAITGVEVPAEQIEEDAA